MVGSAEEQRMILLRLPLAIAMASLAFVLGLVFVVMRGVAFVALTTARTFHATLTGGLPEVSAMLRRVAAGLP